MLEQTKTAGIEYAAVKFIYLFLFLVTIAWITNTIKPTKRPNKIATTADTIGGNWN